MAKDDKKEEKKDEKKEPGKEGETPKAGKKELSPEEAAKKAKTKKKVIFIASGVLLVAGIGIGAMMFLKGGGEHTADGTPSAGEQAKGTGEAGKEGKAAVAGKEGAEAGKGDGKDGKSEATGDSERRSVDFGQTTTLAPFHMNLGNPLENRYVRMEVAVEYLGGEEQAEELKNRMPQLRDAIISVTSKKSREFLLGPDGKDQLRLEIQNKINQYMTRKIENVYITDIMIE